MRRFILSAAFLLTVAHTVSLAAPAVAIIEDAPWSPDDAPRDGAAELRVLLQLAQLQQSETAVGLVGIGDRRGIFQEGTQRGLEFAVRRGVPVVRLARGTRTCHPANSDLLIDGGELSPEVAAALLAECLGRYGPLPKIETPQRPTARELRALDEKLALYRAAFRSRQTAAPTMVAMR